MPKQTNRRKRAKENTQEKNLWHKEQFIFTLDSVQNFKQEELLYV